MKGKAFINGVLAVVTGMAIFELLLWGYKKVVKKEDDDDDDNDSNNNSGN